MYVCQHQRAEHYPEHSPCTSMYIALKTTHTHDTPKTHLHTHVTHPSYTPLRLKRTLARRHTVCPSASLYSSSDNTLVSNLMYVCVYVCGCWGGVCHYFYYVKHTASLHSLRQTYNTCLLHVYTTTRSSNITHPTTTHPSTHITHQTPLTYTYHHHITYLSSSRRNSTFIGNSAKRVRSPGSFNCLSAPCV